MKIILLKPKPMSHFEELKLKQKQQQGRFHEKLMQELELEQIKSSHMSCRGESLERKFINVDCIQDNPPPAQTYDPIHHSPIPKKRHESGKKYSKHQNYWTHFSKCFFREPDSSNNSNISQKSQLRSCLIQ